MKCKICNDTNYKNNLGLSIHLKMHGIDVLTYLIKYEEFKIPTCIVCGKECNRYGLKFAKTCGNKKCIYQVNKGRKHTQETIEKLRKYRFEYLKKRNGTSAWERRNQRKMSYLEQWFFDNCIIKNDLLKRYDIASEYPVYPYFIDFAFLNIKLAVELDGKCHFINGNERQEHDVKKQSYLIENGWKVFRIRYDEIDSDKITHFLKYLDNFEIMPKIFGKELHKGKIIKQKKFRNRLEYINKMKSDAQFRQKTNIEIIKNSGIDFSKYGWNIKVCKILGTNNHSYVKRWLKMYLPEIYKKSYNRKNNIAL